MFPFKIEDKELCDVLKGTFPKGPVHTSIEQLKHKHIAQEHLIRVNKTKVVFANYKLLQHDFPQLNDASLTTRNPEYTTDQKETVIDEWLIRNASFISGPQSQQERVNSPIYYEDEITTVYRPATYGRAVIYSIAENNKAFHKGNVPAEEANDKGLLDVKGAGIAAGKRPTFDSHGDGLLTLEDAFIEYLNQQLIQGIFLHAETKFETLPIYAIIDLGFEVKRPNGARSQACLLLRRAHTRPENSGGLPKYGSDQQLIQLEVELLLRRYGITSSNYITSIEIWKEHEKMRLTYGGKRVHNLTEDQWKNIKEVSHFKDKKICFEGVNVQHTGEYSNQPGAANCTLVDFGGYRVRSVHKNPILSLVSDRLMRWGGTVFPHFDKFVQPDTNIAVPIEHWGKIGNLYGFKTAYRDLKQDIVCKGLADAYRTKELNNKTTIERLDAYLQTATLQWKENILKSANQVASKPV
jgi:hypothetical protein